ncbi:LysR family transcriptional regulator [Lysobacter antibioticus]|uniref:Bacterial regulatory helix-turn-helix, lysR family protein n=1 Tax=Lysobacter antibioticus TaxID=84531 RepID=A0A0S2FI34_LYSAN|nr:LysR family transcriptional regulator [Lysobacter antibioticus]ALN83137.1 bacterial regulatory helix-turn-helix, lysR family protein [Lysobacter antibioticus]
MDRFEAMSMLLEVVRHGSFSAAARTMRVSLPTLSRRISELEHLLGAQLLARTTRKVTLTDAGASYVAAAHSILEQLKEAERGAAGEFVEPIGELVVTAPTMFGRLHVLPVITDFLERYSEIQVRLVLVNTNLSLVEEGIDVAIRIGELPDSAMSAKHVGSIRTVLCGSPRLFEAKGEPRTLDDIAGFPAVAINMPLSIAQWRFRKSDSPEIRLLHLSSRLTVTTPEAAASAAAHGAGLAQLLHYQVADAVKADALRIVLEDLEPTPSPVHLLYASRAPLPLKLRRFLDFAAPRLRNSLQAL